MTARLSRTGVAHHMGNEQLPSHVLSCSLSLQRHHPSCSELSAAALEIEYKQALQAGMHQGNRSSMPGAAATNSIHGGCRNMGTTGGH